MKLIIAIISNKDVEKVLDSLGKNGFSATKVSTNGVFLEDGHSCLFIGVDESKLEEAFDVIKGAVSKRIVRNYGVQSTLTGTLLKQPVDVEEYGGVAFVIDVEDFVKF